MVSKKRRKRKVYKPVVPPKRRGQQRLPGIDPAYEAYKRKRKDLGL